MDALEACVTAHQAEIEWSLLHRALLERVEEFDTPRDRMALVLHATDADIAATAVGKGEMRGVFEVLVAAADDRGLMAYLERATIVLEMAPTLKRDLPDVARLIEIANQIEANHDHVAEALVSLAQLVEDLEEAEDGSADG